MNSIRKRLSITFIVLSICPVLVLGGFLLLQNYEIQQQEAKEIQEKLTKLASHEVSSNIHEQEALLLSMIRISDLMETGSARQRLILSRFLFHDNDQYHKGILNSIVLLDNKGKELVHISRDALITENGRGNSPWAEELLIPVKDREVNYSPVFFNQQTGEPLMNISIPIINIQDMKVKGVLIAEINLKFMLQVLKNIKIGESGTAYILSQNGKIILHPDPSVVLKNTYLTVPEHAGVITDMQGNKSLVASDHMQFGGQTLRIVTELPVSEAGKNTVRSLVAILGFLLITLIGAITIGYVLVRQIIKPIESLSVTAQLISKGDFSQKVQVSKNDEIGTLATAFNSMTTQLIETINSLREQNELMNNILNSLTHPFYVVDANNYTIKLANSAASFGLLSENSTCHSLTHKSDKPCEGHEHPCTIKEIKKTKKPVILEHIHYNSAMQPGFFCVYGYPIVDVNGDISQIIEYSIEVTDKKKLEHQFLQAQKMEAVGQLAGGIAHDFNNLLSAILGYSEMVLTDLPADHPAYAKIRIIIDAGEKASILTRQLLSFSRTQELEVKVVNLNSIVENMSKILRRVIGEDIHLELNTKPNVRNVKADPSQMEQVLMNLAVNARDAMPNGGRLAIETENIELDEKYARSHADVKAGSYVMLAVTDTGIGMDHELQDKIFDPFFTTKGVKGTGLGLSTTYGIIKQHGGNIYVYSEPNVGSTFKVYLPSTEESVENEILKEQEVMPNGTDTILVVEDEPSIRQLVIDSLQPLGYSVLEASCGKEALQICRTTEANIDLLLTDVIMPEMNGRELAEAVRKIKSSIKIIFMSGYTDMTIVQHDMLDINMSFLQKPFTPRKLVSKINVALNKNAQ